MYVINAIYFVNDIMVTSVCVTESTKSFHDRLGIPVVVKLK